MGVLLVVGPWMCVVCDRYHEPVDVPAVGCVVAVPAPDPGALRRGAGVRCPVARYPLAEFDRCRWCRVDVLLDVSDAVDDQCRWCPDVRVLEAVEVGVAWGQERS